MINAIELNLSNEYNYQNEYGEKLLLLSNLKHINIFVGENNSGKSRLMRSLFTLKSAKTLSDSLVSERDFAICKDRIKRFWSKLHSLRSQYVVHESHDSLKPCELYSFYSKQADRYHLNSLRLSFPDSELPSTIINELNSLYRMLVVQDSSSSLFYPRIGKVYIPILRGIECFNLYFNTKYDKDFASISMNNEQRQSVEEYKSNASRIYTNKIEKVYQIPFSQIFTGDYLYKEIKNKLLGEELDRRFIRDLESFISKHFYEGKEFTIIPSQKEGYIIVKIGDSIERPLHLLGDGIKQIICIVYKALELRNSESIVCVEEPEINLHPGFQRKLIEVLQDKEFEKICFFITTHSNHIVDSSFDYSNISVYKFLNVEKSNNTFRVINSSTHDIDLLNQLGVNNSSVFMSNCTIWVEGVSDKIYLNKYLKTYISAKGLKDYKEGVDYSFVEYGGNNIVHWSFENLSDDEHISAFGITNRSFIIVDNDDNSERKRKRKERLQKVFDDRYLELPVREIENTIGNALLTKTLFKGTPTYKPGMEKKKDSIETVSAYVWDYIDKHYNMSKKYWNPYSKQPRVSKLAFAKEVCSHIEGIDDLSESALLVTDRIYNFINDIYNDINK